MKLLTTFILFIVSLSVFADEKHDRIEYKTEYNVGCTSQATAIASSQLNFGWGASDLQGSAGYGNHCNESAIVFGLGQRFKNILFNGSVGSETNSDEYSIGVGVSFRFK